MDDSPTAKTDDGADESVARLFDIRRVIGGLFVLYGALVFVAGLVDGAAAKKQAAGIDINLWTGLGMLMLGAFFLTWMLLRPLQPAQPPRSERES